MPDADVRLKSNGEYWQAWWRCPNGKREVRSLGPKAKYSRRQAAALCRRLALDIAKGDEPGSRPSGGIRLSEWIEKYKVTRSDLSEATLELVGYSARYLMAYFDHDPPIDRITRADASEWRSALAAGELNLDNAQHCRKPGEQTVCRHARTIKTMFNEAENQGRIQANPFAKLRVTPPKPVKQWAYIDPDAMLKIYAACPSPAWKALFGLCRYAGLRREEARLLKWPAVKWDRNQIIVNADIDTETTKKSVRVVPIEPARWPSGLTRLLREVYEASPDAAGPCEGIPSHRKANTDGRIRKIILAAGLTVYSKPLHTLRKNCEMDWAQQYPQHVVSEWIGHDITVSADHYLRVPEEMYAAAGTNCAQSG